MISIDERKKALEKRLSELDGRLHQIEADLDHGESKDWEDAAVEREDDEVLEGMGEAGLHEIEMIQAALGRIEDGTYGDCVKCGEAISQERLNTLPATPFCRRCAV